MRYRLSSDWFARKIPAPAPGIQQCPFRDARNSKNLYLRVAQGLGCRMLAGHPPLRMAEREAVLLSCNRAGVGWRPAGSPPAAAEEDDGDGLEHDAQVFAQALAADV